MQPSGFNEYADKMVEHGGTLIRRSDGGEPQPEPTLYININIIHKY